MKYLQFGRSGLYVSQLAFGTWRIQRTPAAERATLLDAALDAGINLVDTASGYGEGEAETWLGEQIARRGDRDRILIATKSSGPKPREPNGFLTTRRAIIENCERSLRRLGTDWIDLYQLHCVERFVPIDETLMALDDLVRSGKVRAIGTSNFKGWQLVEAQWAASECRTVKFTSDQSEFHLLDRRLERENFPPMETYGMAALIYSPLSQGILSGKYAQGPENTPDDALYASVSENKRDDFFGDRLQGPIRQLIALAEARGHSASQLALAFVMDRSLPTVPIIAPRTMAQLDDCLGACAVTVDDELRAGFDAINPPGEKIKGNGLNRYNHGPTARWW